MSKRARIEDDGESAVSGVRSANPMLATADVYPDVMPIPKSIAVQSPDYFTIKLKYNSWNYHTNAIAGIPAANITTYRINSIVDPDYTNVGGQPMGRDRMAGIFKYYRVLRTDFRITVSACDSGTTGAQWPIAVADLMHTTVTDIGNGPFTTGAMKHGNMRMLGPLNSSRSVITWDRTFYPGLIDQTIDTDNNQGAGLPTGPWTAVTADPKEEQYYTVQTQSTLNGSATNQSLCQIYFQVVYTVQFRETDMSADSTAN